MVDKLRDHRKRPVFIHSSLDDLPLSLEAFRVYCHLARRVNDSNEAWPSYASVAETCFSGSYPNSPINSLKRKAMDAVKELEAWGLIAVDRKQHRADGGQTSNIYSLTDEVEWNSSVEISTRNVRKTKKISSDTPPSDTSDTPPSDTSDTPPSDTSDTPPVTPVTFPSDTSDTPNRRESIEGNSIKEIQIEYSPLTPQGEPEGESGGEANLTALGEASQSESIEPDEPTNPHISTSLVAETESQPKVQVSPKSASYGASLSNDKTINEQYEQITDDVGSVRTHSVVVANSANESTQVTAAVVSCGVSAGFGGVGQSENRYTRNQSQYEKKIDGSDRLPWELTSVECNRLRKDRGDKGIRFHPDFERHMARSLIKTSYYEKLMHGDLMVQVRKHISAGKYDLKRRDELLIEWDAMQEMLTSALTTTAHPPEPMTAKAAARRAKILSALSSSEVSH